MIVSVEGNIGAGKSTLLDALAQRGFTVVKEPVEQWQPLLERFYADPAEYGLPLALAVLSSMHSCVQQHGDGFVIERHPGTTRHVFTQLQFNAGQLSDEAFRIFKEYYKILKWTPDLVLYLDTPVDACYDNIQRRGRAFEAGITKDYLHSIAFQYDVYLRYLQCTVVRGDAQALVAALEKHYN